MPPIAAACTELLLADSAWRGVDFGGGAPRVVPKVGVSRRRVPCRGGHGWRSLSRILFMRDTGRDASPLQMSGKMRARLASHRPDILRPTPPTQGSWLGVVPRNRGSCGPPSCEDVCEGAIGAWVEAEGRRPPVCQPVPCPRADTPRPIFFKKRKNKNKQLKFWRNFGPNLGFLW